MRCLLLHSEDDPLSAAWPRHHWDRVVDMGIASPTSYQALTKVLGCKVERCPPLDAGDFAKLRRMIAFGMGRLVDRQGLDWWELLTLRWVDRFTELLRLDRVMTRLNRATALFVGSGHQARILQLLASCPVTVIPAASKWTRRRVALSSLRPREILEILGDKYDGSYRLRRFVAPPKVRSKMPVVLLPSAYGNDSRTALSYAEALPDIQFLLVATRQSGWTPQAANVSCTRLAAYTASDPIHDELQGLLSSWNDLLADLGCNRELAILRDAGCFDSVPSALREGLGVRNCWLKVFEDEPLRSVLCADEKNLYTRIPVLLGRQRGLPTFACHHGALDGRYLFSEVCADRILAKGLMEWDYLVSGCGVPKENVSIAAPSRPRAVAGPAGWTRRSVVFFSEPYENLGSRARDVYIEVLPRLARIAESYGCELVVKLHPFESRRGRKRLVEQTVLREKRTGIHVIAGPMTETLLQRAWFGVTVSSTTAVDCALKGVPAFLCSWLDSNEYKYADQFAKFGAAEVLRSGEDLENIPKLLESFRAADPQTLWHAAEPRALRELLLGGSESVQTLSGGARVERLWA